MRRLLWIVIAATCCALAADQIFEVASIRTRTDGTGDIWTIKPFRFDVSGPNVLIENFRLSDLITYAYDIQDYELFGEHSGTTTLDVGGTSITLDLAALITSRAQRP